MCHAEISIRKQEPTPNRLGLEDRFPRLYSRRLQNRDLSILVVVLAGVLLSVFATLKSLTSFALTDLVAYAGMPVLTGGLASLADPDSHIGNGIVVGSFSGLSYVAMEVLRRTSTIPQGALLFLVLTVPIWGFLGVAGSASVYRIASVAPHGAVATAKLCGSRQTANPSLRELLQELCNEARGVTGTPRGLP